LEFPKFKSKFEKRVARKFQDVDIEWEYEKEKLPFIQPEENRKYTVDFTLKAFPNVILELKGRFTAQDRKKMLLIKEQYPKKKIIMLFQRAANTLTKSSKTTYAEWCDKHGLAWLDEKEFNLCPFTSIQKKVGKSSSRQKKSKQSSS
jgi:hypothetical protein